jgi:hypothetical protein
LGRVAGRRRAAAVLAAAALLPFVACGGKRPEGVWHVLRPGETIWRVARNYGTTVERIVYVNRIDDVTRVPAGRRLWIAGGHPPEGRGSGTPGAIRSVWQEEGPPVDDGVALRFRWPTEGRLSSGFGRRWGRMHEGIDLAAAPGTPVRAAESGRVIYSGHGLGAYGNVVIVRHSKNYTTVYAHNRRLLVRRGTWVERGDKIAEVGATGRATGPHLHFEVRRGHEPRNPLDYLR